jgi:uncharacterized protein YjbI with pentapeptide repeats
MKQSELDHILNQHKLRLDSNGDQGKRADLAGADLAGADLTGAKLHSANLAGANLRSADLDRANLSAADLTGADLAGANLSGANLSGTNLTRAYLIGSILNSEWMHRAKVNQSQLSWLATDPNFCDWVDRLIVVE